MSELTVKRVKRNVADAFAIVELVADIGKEIIGMIAKYGFDKVSEMKIGDLPGWNAWRTRVIKPNMKKLLIEYRKLRGE